MPILLRGNHWYYWFDKKYRHNENIGIRRIEEFYKFKKQTFNFENFLVRSLDSIRSLDLLLNISIGYLGTLAEKVDESIIVSRVVEASKRLNGLARFTLYAIADGMYEIFSKGYTGILNSRWLITRKVDQSQMLQKCQIVSERAHLRKFYALAPQNIRSTLVDPEAAEQCTFSKNLCFSVAFW